MRSMGYIRQINFLLFLFAIVCLPYSIWLNGLFVILFCLTGVVLLIQERNESNPFSGKGFLIFSSLFFVYAILVLCSGLQYWQILEKKITILLLPFVLGMGILKFSDLKIHLLLWAFVGATFVATLLAFIGRAEMLIHPDINIVNSLLIDRPYFALYSFFCVFILLYQMAKLEHVLFKIGCAILATYFAYFVYAIFAKMAFISFVLTGIICTGIYLLQNRKFQALGLLATGLFIIFLGVIVAEEQLRSFVSDIIHMNPIDIGNGNWVYFSSINSRYVIWSCNVDFLAQGYNWLFGGALDCKVLLDDCYANNWLKYGFNENDIVNFEEHYNPHNQFLQTWVETGIFGLLVLLFVGFYAIWTGLKQRNYLYLSFTIFFFMCCITESVLERQKGIVLYAIFNSLFAFHPIIIKKEEKII